MTTFESNQSGGSSAAITCNDVVKEFSEYGPRPPTLSAGEQTSSSMVIQEREDEEKEDLVTTLHVSSTSTNKSQGHRVHHHHHTHHHKHQSRKSNSNVSSDVDSVSENPVISLGTTTTAIVDQNDLGRFLGGGDVGPQLGYGHEGSSHNIARVSSMSSSSSSSSPRTRTGPGGATGTGSGPASGTGFQTPPFVKWAQSLRNLLDNREGVELFKRFLQQEQCEDSLDFWFACEGLKLQTADEPDRLHQLIKLIYRKYLRSTNAVNITASTRKQITDRLASKPTAGTLPDQRIFDAAQREVEFSIKQSTYPNFLKSDIYLQYVQIAQSGTASAASASAAVLLLGGTQGECNNFSSPQMEARSNFVASTTPSASASACCSLPSSRSSSSGGSSRADVGDIDDNNCGPLPTVLEDCELSMGCGLSSGTNLVQALPLTSRHLMATQRYRAGGYTDVRRPEAYAGMYLRQSPTSKAPNPYHALYASFIPGSAQDSELQSLSSDAHTDDTISLTDSSVDGFPVMNSRKYLRQQNRAMRQNANQNRDPFGQHTFIPRTQRFTSEMYPPSDPQKFASILTEKLEAVLKMQESQEKIKESLRKLEYEENAQFVFRATDECVDGISVQQSQQQEPPLSSVILTAIRDGIMGVDDNDQSILDEHVSRIWDDSSQQTPSSRSPPPPIPLPHLIHPHPLRPRSPDSRRRTSGVALAPAMVHPYHNNNKQPAYLIASASAAAHHSRHRKPDRDVASTFSGDSGAVPDYADSECPLPSSSSIDEVPAIQQQQQMLSHKHGQTRTKVVGDIIDLPRSGHGDHPYATAGVGVGLAQETGGRGRVLLIDSNAKRAGGGAGSSGGCKKFDSSSSGVDSGVSVAYEPSQASSFNSREKVMSWVLENKKYCSSQTSDSEKDSSVRHKKSTYSSMSATSPGPNRPGRVKKPNAYTSSRSGSLERSGHNLSWPSAQPNQPFMSDPSMPILPPPNTTTQLEEARRRLEDDTKAKILAKSKSGVLGKEKFYHVDMVKGVRQSSSSSSSNKMVPGGVGLSAIDSQQDDGLGAKKQSKRMPAPIASGVVSSLAPVANSASSPMTTNTGMVGTAAIVAPANVVAEFTAVVYQFLGETVPYLSKLPGKNIVLKQFKTLITKKSNFRYFFKKASDEFDAGCIYEELTEDCEQLPLFEGKIFARLEAID